MAYSYHRWLWLIYDHTISQSSYREQKYFILPPTTLYTSHSAFQIRVFQPFKHYHTYECN